MESAVKDRIILGASDIFFKNGCRSITMDEIAGSLGVSKRTIYENFKDKKDLLLQCITRLFEEGDENMQEVLNSSDNVLEAMFKREKNTSEIMHRMKYNFFDELAKYYPDIYLSTVKKFRMQHFKKSVEMIKKGKQDGVFRKDVNINAAAALIQEMANLVINVNAFAEYEIEKREIMVTFMSCFARGLSTAKGSEIIERYNDLMK